MWTFGRKIALGFALSFLLMLVIGGVSYRSISTLNNASHAVEQNHQLVFELNELVRLVSDLESQQRGYLLTGDESYLPQMTATTASVPRPEAALRQLLGNDAARQQQLTVIMQKLTAKTSFALKSVELYRAGNKEAALKLVQTGDGKTLMDDLLRVTERMDEDERRALKQRAEEVEAASLLARMTILFGTLFALVVVSAAGWALTRSLSSQIGSAVKHVQHSSAELQSAANQQAAGARESATSMNEITTTITELLASSRQIAESAQRVVGIAEQSATAARHGEGTLQAAHQSMNGMREQIDLVVDHMLDLGRKSQQIGAVLDIVGELAEQTNILAINATIEATVAGDAGKRFGVIADEIRKLADRMAASTKEIRVQIEDVRGAVNSTVMATETGSKAVEAGTRQFGEVTTAIGQISGMAVTTADAAREIELSTKQQATAVEQVNMAIANTAQAARETEASSSQTLQTASQLAGMSRDLLRLVQPQVTAS